jgi:hypothetical protein
MKDENGKVTKNAHLIGTVRRILKVCISLLISSVS